MWDKWMEGTFKIRERRNLGAAYVRDVHFHDQFVTDIHQMNGQSFYIASNRIKNKFYL